MDEVPHERPPARCKLGNNNYECKWSIVNPTYRVINDGLEQLSALYGAVETLPAPRVALQEERVREQAAGLTREHHYAPMAETSA